jgi:protein-S-isoprenylcysteine O-methyltransferase Ste14
MRNLPLRAILGFLLFALLLPAAPFLAAGRMDRPAAWDRLLMPLVGLVGPLAIGLVAGLDHRFAWSAPLLLGSWAALIPGALQVLAIIVRTALEDRLLQASLPGYRDYANKTRSRLLPGLW